MGQAQQVQRPISVRRKKEVLEAQGSFQKGAGSRWGRREGQGQIRKGEDWSWMAVAATEASSRGETQLDTCMEGALQPEGVRPEWWQRGGGDGCEESGDGWAELALHWSTPTPTPTGPACSVSGLGGPGGQAGKTPVPGLSQTSYLGHRGEGGGGGCLRLETQGQQTGRVGGRGASC